MAIDPTISLAVRPVQMPLPNIQSPVDQLAQVLSLRNLMTQGQLGQIGLQSKQLEYEQLQQRVQEQRNISKILADEWGGHPQDSGTPVPAGSAPAPAPPIAPPPAGEPAPSAPLAPGDIAPLPDAPQSVPGLTNIGALPSAPPAPGAPTAPLSNLVMPPAGTPPGAPAMPSSAIPQAAAQAPTLGFSPNVYRRIILENPVTGPAFVESMTKTVNAQYDQLEKGYKGQQNAAQRESTLIQGINDEPTKFAAVAQMSNEGLINPAEREHMLALPYNSPYFKSRADMALSRSDFMTQEQKAIQEARDAEKSRYEISQRPVQEKKAGAEASKAETEALQGELTAGAQSFASVNDPSQITRWLANVGPRAQQVYLKGFQNLPPNASLDDVKNMVAGNLKESVTKGAEIQAEQAKYQPTVNAVITGKQPWENLDPETQKAITPLLNAQGFTGIAQKLSDDERNRLGAYDRALTILNDTKDKLKDEKTRDLMGPLTGLLTHLPYAEDHKKLQSDFLLQQQELKKFISDGSVRGLNEDTLGKMFPTISTLPKVADSQVDNLVNTITKERNSYIQDLSGKAIPKAMLPKTQPTLAPPAPANPAAPENIFGPSQVKIVSPEPAATPAQPAAGLAPAQQAAFPKAPPPPGKMSGVKSDGKGGWKGVFFNAKDADEARRQGVIF